MKLGIFFLAGLLLIGCSGARGAAMAANNGSSNTNDSVILKQRVAPGSDYCHEKFRAIDPETLGTDHPTLEGPSSADIVDFYGPCEETPTGPDQAWQQKLQDELQQDYN
jgi:hypothetical protein